MPGEVKYEMYAIFTNLLTRLCYFGSPSEVVDLVPFIYFIQASIWKRISAISLQNSKGSINIFLTTSPVGLVNLLTFSDKQ